MARFFSQFDPVVDGVAILKTLAEGSDWQICLTDADCCVLAVGRNLFDLWVLDYALPEGLFLEDIFPDCRVFLSSGDCLISSLQSGPFPSCAIQIEAFSEAFGNALEGLISSNAQDAVYIEEYSLLLPLPSEQGTADAELLYGRWIAGGEQLSIKSFGKVCKKLPDIPRVHLLRCARLAGFDPKGYEEDEKDDPVAEIPKSNERFSLVGRPELENFFNEYIIDIVLNRKAYEKMGISFPGATILSGPSGSGKTYAVESLAKYLNWQLLCVDLRTVEGNRIPDIICAAIKAAPSVLVFDGIDSFLTLYSKTGFWDAQRFDFFRRIPEAVSKGVLVFVMTDMADAIDPAFLRIGQINHIVKVTMPSAADVEAMLLHRFKSLPIAKSVNAGEISVALNERPLSDVTFVLREAGRFAVKRNLDEISPECFFDAIALLPKAVKQTKIGFVKD